MALQKQNLSLPFAQGIDTKTDPKQVVPGKLLVLENGIFQTGLSIRKRNGNQAFSTEVLSNSSISNGIGIATFKNQLNLFDGTSFYSRNEGPKDWSLKGKLTSTNFVTEPIVKNGNTQTNPDSAYNVAGNISVYVWEDSSGGSRYSVLDHSTSQQIITNQLLSANAASPKVVSLGNRLVIFYVNTSTVQINQQYISVATPNVISSPIAVTSDLKNQMYDVVTIGSRIFLSYNKNTGGIANYYFDSTLSQSAQVLVGADSATSMNAFGDSSNRLWIAYYSGTVVKAFIRNYDLTLALALTTIETIAGVRNITGAVLSTTATIFYEITAVLDYNHFIRKNTLTLTGTVGTPSTLIRSVGLASKAFSFNLNIYVSVVYPSSIQGKFFLIDQTNRVALRYSGEANLGGGLTSKSVLPAMNSVTSDTFQFAYLQVDAITFSPQTNDGITTQVATTQNGVMQGLVMFDGSSIFSTIELGANLNITGGIPSIYDGNSIIEQGFNLYPENISGNYRVLGGGLSHGQYQYRVTYEWLDNFGQTHRSAPSVPLTIKIDDNITQFVGNLTSGDGHITSVSANAIDHLYISNTMFLSGVGIPADTYLVDINYVGPIPAMSVGASSTQTQTVITAAPMLTFLSNLDLQSGNTVRIEPVKDLYRYGTITNASNLYVVDDVSQLAVGMTLVSDQSFFAVGTRITAISGNTLTLSNPSNHTDTNVVSKFEVAFTGDTAIGSPTINSISPVFIPLFKVGDYISSPTATTAGPGLPKILSIGATSIVVDQNYTNATTGAAFNQRFNADQFLLKGQVLRANVFSTTSIPFVGEAIITDISVGASNLITMDTANAPISSTLSMISPYSVKLSIPTLRVTSKTGVTIVIYRTEADGTIFYRVNTVTQPINNDPTIDSVEYIDTTPDAIILDHPQLYITGGVVENIAAPPHDISTIYRNREIVVPSENPLTWWYSQQVIPGSPVEFSDSFVNNIDQRGGDITAVGVLDEKLIFFKDTHIFYTVGDGPAPNGTNNDFLTPQLISTETGSNNQKSIIMMPFGLMFQSPKGIYLLARNLETLYIGAEVEAFNSATVTSAKLMETVNQVRFTLDTGVALVYDYEFKQWSVFTNHAAVDSCIFENKFTYLQSNGIVMQETPNIYTDNGNFIKLKLVTSWLSFAQLQGFQRVYKALILGDYISPHRLHVQVSHDFNPNFTQEDYIDAGTILAQDTYGSDAYYGADYVYGSPTGYPRYQWRINFERQKCETIQLLIEDMQSINIGQGLSLSAIAFEVGAKKGLDKLGAPQSFG